MSAHANSTTASSLRPRTRRLISLEDDGLGTSDDHDPQLAPAASSLSSSNALQNAVSSAFAHANPRSQSPLPASHPSRGTSATRGSAQQQQQRQAGGRSSSTTRSFGLQIPAGQQRKSPSLWQSSWAGLQGVASSLLGNNSIGFDGDGADSETPVTPGGSRRKGAGGYGKGGAAAQHRRNYSITVPEQPWGPAPVDDGPMTIETLATGSAEERLARVQAEKRKMLLAGGGEEARDGLGRYKRRNSEERRDSVSSPTGGDDALVYVHKVLPTDSVAGLSIRYNCPQAVVRKTNRLWPNDSIQVRKVAFMPVDACAVRGVRLDNMKAPESNLDLLAGTEDVSKQQNGHDDYQIASADEEARQGKTEPTEEQPWTHESWVRLPTSSEPVEIGRLPRRMLGWFPPARRKSINYSDTSPPRSVNSSTPPSNAASALNPSLSLRSSPNRTLSPSRPVRPSRTNSAASRLNPNAPFHSHPPIFRGTGGVGSLHSNVRGPAPDELNKFVATHLPLLSIQDTDAVLSGTHHAQSRSASNPLRPSVSGPRLSFDRLSVASGGSGAGAGVEAMAGAVEGWLRKAGGKVKSIGTPEMRGRARAGTGTGEGDLIELTDGWDLNGSPARTPRGGDQWESEGHGVLDRAGGSMSASAIAIANASAREDEERLLRERFPPVGKVFEAAGKRA